MFVDFECGCTGIIFDKNGERSCVGIYDCRGDQGIGNGLHFVERPLLLTKKWERMSDESVSKLISAIGRVCADGQSFRTVKAVLNGR
jgi:hypothetical protein